MNFVLAVYRSRSVTICAYNYLQKSGVTCVLVSTPRAANVGCGLSVKFAKADLPRVRNVLADAETFVGFFCLTPTRTGSTLTRI